MNTRILTLLLCFVSIQAWAAPNAPSNLTASPLSTSRILLSWQDNSNDEVRFRIGIRSSPLAQYASIGPFAADTTSATVISLSPRTTYEFIVVAEDATGGQSLFSNAALGTTLDLAPLPGLTPPFVSGTPPISETAAAGSPALQLPLHGLFSDSDVSSAARLTTDLGNIDFVFFPGAAPVTVTNFLNYLNRGNYNNSFFHRSVPGFVIQGGSFLADSTISQVPTDPPIVNEPVLSNTRGTVAMSKLGNNPNSATSGFFISLANNSAILNPQNGGFTVFARVAGTGMSVVDAIAALPTHDYSALRAGLLNTTPYRNPPASPYDPGNMVRVLNATTIAPLSLTATSSDLTIATATVDAGNLVLVPTAPGVATITLTATDLDGLSTSTSFPFTVTQDSYASWSSRQPFANGQDTLATADPDKDGRNNLAEFALNSPPLASSPADLLPNMVSGKFAFHFPLRLHTSGITVALESSETLAGPWTQHWSTLDGLIHPWILAATISGNTRTLTAQNPSPANPPREFLRLKITQN